MINLHLCVSATCDTCHEDAVDGDGEVIFFDGVDPAHTVRDALTEVGWRVGPGDQLTCPQCLADAACVEHGHAMEAWWACRCGGVNQSHHAGPDGRCVLEHRYCARCGHYGETRRATPTTDPERRSA